LRFTNYISSKFPQNISDFLFATILAVN